MEENKIITKKYIYKKKDGSETEHEYKYTQQRNKEYNNDYYEKNKDKLKSKIKCECGREYTKTNHSQHIKTSIHKKLLIEKELNIITTFMKPEDYDNIINEFINNKGVLTIELNENDKIQIKEININSVAD